MSVVIDASALVAFVTNEPTAPTVSELIQHWGSEGTEMNAPVLARYEIANALAKQAAAGNLSDEALDEPWDILDELPIVYHRLRDGPSVVRTALALQRRSAYRSRRRLGSRAMDDRRPTRSQRKHTRLPNPSNRVAPRLLAAAGIDL